MGESKEDKDRMLLELEKECLQVYRKKFEEVSRVRAQLHHEVATKEAELAALMASLGEHNLQSQVHHSPILCLDLGKREEKENKNDRTVHADGEEISFTEETTCCD